MTDATQLRLTDQRRVILASLRGSSDHPTVDDVFIRARKQLPRISLATVYRNLEDMASAGLVSKLGPAEGPRRYDGRTDPHFHIRCTSCGAVADVPYNAQLGELVRDLATNCETKFTVRTVQVEWLGTCPRCRRTLAETGDVSTCEDIRTGIGQVGVMQERRP